MQSSRIGAIFVILTMASVISFLIIKNTVNIEQVGSGVANNNEKENNGAKKPTFEPLAPALNSLNSGANNNGEAIKAEDTSNLTNYFTKKISEQILLENKSGPRIIDGKYKLQPIPPTEIITLLKKTDSQKVSFKPIIADKDIVIGESETSRDIKNYTDTVIEATKRNFLGLSVAHAYELEDPSWASNIESVVNAYHTLAQEFEKISVPRKVKELHKEWLALIIAQKNIFTAIADYQNDPLKAVRAVNELVNVANGFRSLNLVIQSIQ